MKFNQDPAQLKLAANNIKLLLLDVDGVLTDGRLYFTNSGEEFKSFHTLDGHGIKMLMSTGVDVGIITGRQSEIVRKRCADLGIKILFQGREDKLNVLHQIITEKSITHDSIAYAGDDLPDLPVLRAVGLSFSVPGGHDAVTTAVHAITDAHGGSGAVREITDYLITARGLYDSFIDQTPA